MPGKSIAPDSTRVIRLARISSRTVRPRRGGSAQRLFLRSPKVRGSIMSKVALADSEFRKSLVSNDFGYWVGGAGLDKAPSPCSFAPRATCGLIAVYPGDWRYPPTP